jgi:hypothetical protein
MVLKWADTGWPMALRAVGWMQKSVLSAAREALQAGRLLQFVPLLCEGSEWK